MMQVMDIRQIGNAQSTQERYRHILCLQHWIGVRIYCQSSITLQAVNWQNLIFGCLWLPARAVGILQDSSVTPHCLLHWFILSCKESEDETCWARVSFQTLLNSLLSSDIARRSSKHNASYFRLLLWPVCHPFFFSDKHVRKVSIHRILEPLAFALQRLFHQKVVDVAALQGNEVANSNGDRP